MEVMDIIKLFIIEDQPAILKQQIKMFESFNDIEIVGFALSGEDAIEKIVMYGVSPSVILCDLGLPNMSGIEVTKRIKDVYPQTEILIFTVFEEEDQVLRAIQAGASGYLLKDAAIEKIHDAIVEVFNGGTIIQPSLARKLLKYFALPVDGTPEHRLLKNVNSDDRTPLLTIRELECLQMIAKGLSNHEAASVLKLSKSTIRTHLEHIYQKLEVSNRVEAITEGIRQGIINL